MVDKAANRLLGFFHSLATGPRLFIYLDECLWQEMRGVEGRTKTNYPCLMQDSSAAPKLQGPKTLISKEQDRVILG